ncbi:hypothetical protein DMB44_04300 [Thermoplasma sp. Kam2015]|uniref:AlbA family DNA-binding domain-containing protein n=1 Tax=Thermoplasma sp. Kam2015 TaxID=2094122 RepID=UPI000D9483A2|nr:ATP-binding protein [Thermoplasma sp. Kam2015]PYB68561.1 hypothetical protein DMB44_04300 [Thermoplasma sp. Kam2015]
MLIEKILGSNRPSFKDLERFKAISNEDVQLEFKRDISNIYTHLLNPVSAFANTRGGLLVIGIDDETHDVFGIKEKADKIENLIKEYIEPSLSGLYHIHEIKTDDGKFVHLIEVGLSPYIHAVKEEITCFDQNEHKNRNFLTYNYWTRTGPSTRKMEPSVLNRIANLKANYVYNFEYRVKIFKILNNFLFDLVREVNKGREEKIEVINLHAFANSYLKKSDKKLSDKKFVDLFNSSSFLSMYEGYYGITIDLYIQLYKVRYIPHTILTYNEDYLFIDLLNMLISAFNLGGENINLDFLTNIQHVSPRNEIFFNKEPPLTALSFVSYMFQYATNDDHDQHWPQLNKFINTISSKIYRGGKGSDIKFCDLKRELQFFLEPVRYKEGVIDLFQKYNIRYEQFLSRFCSEMSKLIISSIKLRNSIYESLMLPIPIDSVDHALLKTKEENWFY